MGCYSGKAKRSFENTKPIDRGLSIVAPVNELHRPNAERTSQKHKGQIGEPRLLKDQQSTETQNGELQTRKKTPKEYEEISKSLSTHFLFNSISSESIFSVIDQMQLFAFAPKTVVFTQNSPAKNFYIVAAGRVDVIVNGKVKKVAAKGEHFGELALLHESLRTETVMTNDKAFLWVLDGEVFRMAVQNISIKKYAENKQFVESIPIFQNFTVEQKEILLSMIVTHEFKEGHKVVTEGEPGNLMYIIKSGSVSCLKAGKEIRKLWPGDFFGEQALLYNTQRTATVSTLTKVTLLSLGRDDLVAALGSHLQQIIYRNSQRIAIEKSSALKVLTKSQSEAAIGLMTIQSYSSTQIVIGRGSPKGDKIYIVLKGCLKAGNKMLGIYSCIGDEQVLNSQIEKWEENWIADVDSDIALLLKEDLERALGDNLCKITSQNEVLSVMRRVQLLRSLPIHKLEPLVSALKIFQYDDGEIIFSEGDQGDAFYIVKEGQVEIMKGENSIRVITKHDFFGERSIILQENRTATVIARGTAKCWYLSKKDFLSMIDEGIRIQLSKRMELQNDKIELQDLTIVKLLGKGMFGNVFLAYNNITNVCYALKTVQRTKVFAYDIYDNLTLERKILLQVDHPLIVKLVKTFKDQQRIYFLMEFVQGVDLFDALRDLNLLNNESSRFYISCILLIFEHLHERNIIYRDLKPENIMVDGEGYPKLIDFGTAKIILQRTYTMVGTPHYMAPEIIKGIGYNLSADIWSIGIMLFEFVCGFVPFGEDEEDPYKIYTKILERVLKYPAYISSNRAKPIIEKMLDNNPAMRGNITSLKEQQWFIGVSWDSLLGKQVKSPYIPKNINNISAQLQRSLKMNKTLSEAISQYEEENIEAPANAKVKIPHPGWDDDF